MSRKLILYFLHIYRKMISPLTPPSCRFYPTCSQYAVEAITLHGTRIGGWLVLKRIVKCGPWHPGGYDPVPEKCADSSPNKEDTR